MKSEMLKYEQSLVDSLGADLQEDTALSELSPAGLDLREKELVNSLKGDGVEDIAVVSIPPGN